MRRHADRRGSRSRACAWRGQGISGCKEADEVGRRAARRSRAKTQRGRLRPEVAAMARPVRFGVTLPQIKRSWAETSACAREIDALGFDSLWVCDHVYGVPMPNLPILEAWTLLAAVAAITERAKLGTLVTPPFFRNPAILAKQIATIEQIAPGRVIAGLGAGWFPPEFEQTGCAFPSTRERLRALEETVEIL